MYVFQALVSLGWLIAVGEASLNFINPSPAGANKDYSADPVYTMGESITIAWSGSETGVPLTLAMLQQTIEGEGDATQDVIIDSSVAGLSSYVWTISTDKNLTASNVFFFDLFANQSLSPDSTSHYINITESDTTSATTSTTTSSVSTSSIATATTTSSSAITAVSSATSSATATSSAPVTSGLSSDAKIGIGVGIAVPVSLAIGAFLGWFFYRRRANKTGTHAGAPGPGPAGDHTSNASMRTPSHMGVNYMPGGEGDMQYRESKYSHGSHQFSTHGSHQLPTQQDLYNGQQISPQFSGHNPEHLPVQLDSEATAVPHNRAYEML